MKGLTVTQKKQQKKQKTNKQTILRDQKDSLPNLMSVIYIFA